MIPTSLIRKLSKTETEMWEEEAGLRQSRNKGPHAAELTKHGQVKTGEGSTSPQGQFVRPKEDQAGRKRRTRELTSGGLGRWCSPPREQAREGPAHPGPPVQSQGERNVNEAGTGGWPGCGPVTLRAIFLWGQPERLSPD